MLNARAVLVAAAMVLSSAALAQSALETARDACERDLSACPERDRLEAAAKAERPRPVAPRSQVDQQFDDAAAAEAAALDALRLKCGSDYMRVRVGMSFARVRQCAGDFARVAEDQRGAVYEASGGVVRVESGKVVRWVAK